MTGAVNQIAWAKQIKTEVHADFDLVANILKSAPPSSLSFTIVRVSADGVLRSKQAILLLQHSQFDH